MITKTVYENYFQALLAGERSKCTDIIQTMLDEKIDLKILYYEIFHKSLYQVGELWERNIISVAREHLATSITENLLNLAYPLVFKTQRVNKKAVISCSSNEYHQIGGKMIADIFELHGWGGHFLGANMSTEDVAQQIDDIKPDLVGLSLSILSNIDNLKTGIESIKVNFPNMDLLVGGQAFRWGGVDMIKKYPAIEYVPSMDDLEKLIG